MSKKPVLRPTTGQEHNTHAEALKELLRQKKHIEEGFNMGMISKSQMKKGLADTFNQKNKYMADNMLWVMAGKIFIWEIQDAN